MHKKITSFIVAITIVGTLSIPVLASPISEEQNKVTQNKQELNKNKDIYNKVLKEVEAIDIKIEKFDIKIEELLRNINNANVKIDKTNEEINLSKMELDKAEVDMEAEQEIFGKRARNLYMNGKDSYLEVILNSKGLHDFIGRVENLRAIANHDKKVMKELKGKQEKIQKRKVKLELEKKNLITLKEKTKKDLEKVKSSRKEQEEVINEFNAKKQKYADIIAQYNAKIEESQRKIDAINNPISRTSRGGNYNVPAAGPLASRAVQYAYQFQGVPYVSGGQTPSGFDCSGFVQYVYRQLGVNISRTTYTQINDGVPVGAGQLQPGDLVFFGSSSAPGHVGMYVGGGRYIHSPHTGDSVKISSLNRSDFCAARRIAY